MADSDNYIGFEKPIISAVSVRGPFRNETLVATVTTASKRYNVPDGTGGANQPSFKGRYVNCYADGADVYLQLSKATDAFVNEAQASTETTVSGAINLTPQGDECWVIPKGQWQVVPFRDAVTWAIKGSAAGKLRMHLAEN
jgi:hypothetical protein